jgi:hypothetical protein
MSRPRSLPIVDYLDRKTCALARFRLYDGSPSVMSNKQRQHEVARIYRSTLRIMVTQRVSDGGLAQRGVRKAFAPGGEFSEVVDGAIPPHYLHAPNVALSHRQ